MERCPFIQCCFCPNAASVPMKDALNQRQTHTRSLKFIFMMQALKDAKQFVSVFGIEANTIVLHVVDVFFALGAAAEFDPSAIAVAGEFNRVGEEINEYL